MKHYLKNAWSANPQFSKKIVQPDCRVVLGWP